MPRNVSLSYYPWITQSIGGPQLAKAIQDFAQLLGTELSGVMGEQIDVQVLPAMDVADQIENICLPPAHPADLKIAFMNPIGYALTHERIDQVQSIAVVRRRISTGPAGPTYRAQIYTHVQTGIQTLSDLRKRTFAFGSPQSTSNFLVPAHMLWRASVHPLNGFSRLEYAGGHDTVAKAVYERKVDAGAGHDGVITDLAARPGYEDAAAQLIRLVWSDPIPSDPVVVNTPDTTAKAALVEALGQMAPANNPGTPGNVAIKAFWGTAEGVEPIAADGYRALLPYLNDLSLRPDDVLKKW